MQIKLLCVGKTHSAYLTEGLDEYTKRVNKYVKFEITPLPDIKNTAGLSEDQRKNEEGKIIVENIPAGAFIVLLDEKGKEYTSEKFADQWQRWFNQGCKHIICVVGGPYGFSKEMYERANAKISLSTMTFSHEMVRLFFVEQLYRSLTIIKNEPYHHR